jgi:hypothetical protein
MKKLFFIISFFTCLLFTDPLQASKILAEKTGSKINVTVGDRFFTSYIFSDDEKYPFFYPVNGPVSGGSVTSIRNGEYPHHSSLFFGCDQVNGGNFWQEGLDRGRIVSLNAKIVKQGGDTAIITDECIWSRNEALSPVRDIRKFTITAPDAGIRIIDAEISMEMLTDVTIHKTNHSLFSVRMAADLSVLNGGTMINAEGLEKEEKTFGKSSPWIDYSGKRGKGTEGLAILQHPTNPWYPSPWFTRDYGFMSPTPMFWPENGSELFLKKGTVLKLRYRVIVHSGDYKEAKIAEEFTRYKNE